MLCDRENNQDLFDFSGEFAGKYLISACTIFTNNTRYTLKRTIKQFVEKLIQCQDHNGYIGPLLGADRMHRWDLWVNTIVCLDISLLSRDLMKRR